MNDILTRLPESSTKVRCFNDTGLSDNSIKRVTIPPHNTSQVSALDTSPNLASAWKQIKKLCSDSRLAFKISRTYRLEMLKEVLAALQKDDKSPPQAFDNIFSFGQTRTKAGGPVQCFSGELLPHINYSASPKNVSSFTFFRGNRTSTAQTRDATGTLRNRKQTEAAKRRQFIASQMTVEKKRKQEQGSAKSGAPQTIDEVMAAMKLLGGG